MLSVAPLVTTPAAAVSNPYVLLVDDHKPSLRGLHEVVSLSGHRCLSTSSPSDAVRLCDRSRPQVVVTDLGMPNLDGQALARWLRMRFPSLPIILMTGQDLDPPTCRQLLQTFTAILAKPVEINHFLSLLDRLMPPLGNRAPATPRP